MRILHVTPSIARSYGGPTQSLLGYVRAARHAGLDVEVAAPEPPAEDAAWLDEQLGSGAHLFPSAGSGAFVSAPSLLQWLKANGGAFDVIHVHGLLNPVSSLSTRACVRHGWPVVVRPFGMLSRFTFDHRRRAMKLAYHMALDRPNLRRVGGVHFTSEGEREGAAWLRLGLGARSHVVPPPVSVPDARADESGAIPEVLCLARLHPVKRIEALIDAWPAVLASIPSARLTLAGDGDPAYARALRDRTRLRGVSDSVSFPGFVNGVEKAALLSRARLFVLPSQHENFGVSVVEAIGVGLPVVISPEVQLAPFVLEHRLGLVVDGTPEALSDAVVLSIGDSDLRDRCRRTGPSVVASHFSLERVGAALSRMYRKVEETPHNAPGS